MPSPSTPDLDASILLGATLMHWGVPFRFAAKRELTERQQAIIDQAAEKLIALRKAQPAPGREGADSAQTEIPLLADVVENCLEECGNDAVELRLQLKTADRREIEALLDRLRSCLESARQPLHN